MSVNFYGVEPGQKSWLLKMLYENSTEVTLRNRFKFCIKKINITHPPGVTLKYEVVIRYRPIPPPEVQFIRVEHPQPDYVFFKNLARNEDSILWAWVFRIKQPPLVSIARSKRTGYFTLRYNIAFFVSLVVSTSRQIEIEIEIVLSVETNF